METIDYNELLFEDEEDYNSGSFAKIKICYFDGKKYVYKYFNNHKYLDGKRKKIDLLSEINEPGLYMPKYWVRKNGNKDMYLTDFFKGMDILIASDEDEKHKLMILKQSKDRILKMHELGIIHSDLIGSNMMYNENETAIIDFDNSSIGKYLTNIYDANDYAQDFIKKYGIRKEIDIYLFNLLTYSIMTNTDIFKCRSSIATRGYKVFKDSLEARKICDSLLLTDDKINPNFLIDTIESTISF